MRVLGFTPRLNWRGYPVPMLILRPAFLTLMLLSACPPVLAARIKHVDIDGGTQAMRQNVRLALSLADALDEQISEWRLNYLLRIAEDEARQALEPFGYYTPTITLTHNAQDEDEDAITVEISIAPGEPVRVHNARIAITGAGAEDAVLQGDLAGFAPAPGAVFNHAEYEASKLRISRRLTERGYFDAEYAAHQVTVSRADQRADIELAWISGGRYRMGDANFIQTRPVIGAGVLSKLVHWQPGQDYHLERLDTLRSALRRLDYFAQIDIQTPMTQALEQQLPVNITLTPAKRTVYTTGVSYGTDSGSGFRLGMERRYVNPGGHKLGVQLDYTQNRQSLTAQYRIPAFAWRDGWYTLRAQGYDEKTSYLDTRRTELTVSRSVEYRRTLNLAGSVHALRERWAVDVDGGSSTRPLYRRAYFSYPSVRADYSKLDDRLFPRKGLVGTLRLRSGIDGAVSNASFLQFHARASRFFGLGEWTRLSARGEAGYTWTNALTEMPPSLRFYAGGDRSIRGYDFREVGPRLVRLQPDDEGVMRQVSFYALGARNVVTGSVELEHYFRSNWGAAVFVDGGSAFDGTAPNWHTGVGIGLRWKSPVGPLRVDIARGLNSPDSPFTLGLGIGTEF